MAFFIHTEGHEPREVATEDKWSDLCDWIDTLDPAHYGELASLREDSEAEDVAMLRIQLAAAIAEQCPADGVLETATVLDEILMGFDSWASVVVTNGLDDDFDHAPIDVGGEA